MATNGVLPGKRVVVIGASSGIGRAVATASAAAGAAVVLASRSAEKLNDVRRQTGGEAVPTDMLDEDSVNRLFERAGVFDHLVVTAVADENKLRSLLAAMTTATAKRGLEKFWGRSSPPVLPVDGGLVLTWGFGVIATLRCPCQGGVRHGDVPCPGTSTSRRPDGGDGDLLERAEQPVPPDDGAGARRPVGMAWQRRTRRCLFSGGCVGTKAAHPTCHVGGRPGHLNGEALR